MSPESKQYYQEKLKAQWQEFNGKIEELMAKGKQQKAQTSQEIQDQIEELRNRRDRAQEQLENLQQTSEESWQEVKEGFENAWEDLKTAFDKASSKLK